MRVTVNVGTFTIRAKPPQDKEVSCRCIQYESFNHYCYMYLPPLHMYMYVHMYLNVLSIGSSSYVLSLFIHQSPHQQYWQPAHQLQATF